MTSFRSRSLGLLLALLFASIGIAAQQSGGSAVNSPSPQNQPAGDGARRITPAEARAALEAGEAILVDVRSGVGYEAGHVKGALSIPFSEVLSRIDEFPRDKMIITYCS